MTTVALGEAKDRLSEYIAGVENTHDRVVITRHGRPAAVLISPEDLAALEETVDILTTPGAPQAIAEGLEDLKAGRIVRTMTLCGPALAPGDPHYEIRVSARAERDLVRLPEKIGSACVEFIFGPLGNDPYRLGGPLTGQLAGLRAARRGSYRISYQVDDQAQRIDVVHIDHRGGVYRAELWKSGKRV